MAPSVPQTISIARHETSGGFGPRMLLSESPEARQLQLYAETSNWHEILTHGLHAHFPPFLLQKTSLSLSTRTHFSKVCMLRQEETLAKGAAS